MGLQGTYATTPRAFLYPVLNTYDEAVPYSLPGGSSSCKPCLLEQRCRGQPRLSKSEVVVNSNTIKSFEVCQVFFTSKKEQHEKEHRCFYKQRLGWFLLPEKELMQDLPVGEFISLFALPALSSLAHVEAGCYLCSPAPLLHVAGEGSTPSLSF